MAGDGGEANRPRRPRWSVVSLLAANMIPLSGVVFLGWRVFPVMLLFSLENIIIGFYNVLRMIPAKGDYKELRHPIARVANKLGAAAFFTLHYGAFAAVHLAFVFILFSRNVFSGAPVEPLPGDTVLQQAWSVVDDNWVGLAAALVAIFISHGVSYVKNYIQAGEYKQAKISDLMGRPYARVMVMHVTIIAGAALIAATGTHAAAVALLVILKTGVDLVAHLRERKKFARTKAA